MSAPQRWLLGLSGGCLLLLAGGAAADSPKSDGIEVSATGEVKTKPDTLVILGEVTGSGVLSADAIVKYRNNRRRVLSVVEAMKHPNLKAEVLGLSIEASKMQTDLKSELRVSMSGIREMPEETLMETMAQILDELRDSAVAENPEVFFLVTDAVAVRDAASSRAMSQAQGQAERLARLAGVRLGGVLAIEVQYVPRKTRLPDDDDAQDEEYQDELEYIAAMLKGTADDEDQSQLVSRWFREIPVQIRLRVRFGIERALVGTTDAAVRPPR